MWCCFALAKFGLSLFNFISTLLGVTIISFGFSLLENLHGVDIRELKHHDEVPLLIIGVGAVVIILSIIGFCGALKESFLMGIVYSVFLGMLACSQVIVVAFVWVNKDRLTENMQYVLETAFLDKSIFGDDSLRPMTMDAIQSSFKCCGKVSFLDYLEEIPPSCCIHNNCRVASNVYNKGCANAFGHFWLNNGELIEQAGLFIAGLELLGSLISCILAYQFKRASIALRTAVNLPRKSPAATSHIYAFGETVDL